MHSVFSRRAAMLGAAALPMLRTIKAQARPRNIVISSGNGVRACAKAMEVIKAGGDTLDAVIAGVNIQELDPNDTSVGYGGLPNEEGVVELDASCMHGPSRRGGSVAALRGIKTPSNVAKLVMTETDHMMLAGEGALRFAKAHGFKEEDLLTDRSRMAWLAWKREMRDSRGHTNWQSITDAPPKAEKRAELKRLFPDASDELIAWAFEVAAKPTTGTINCIALNGKGEMSATTTTSGMAWKIPGRVGDSPIIGGGLWLDQDVGGAGSTGRGEENLRVAGAHTCVENMRHGMSAKEAALDALKRVARNFDSDEKRLAAVDLQFYVLRKDGDYCGASLWNKPDRTARNVTRFAICTEGAESHLEDSVWLLERK
ncbi:MAG TPA: N(4)-(beta-N-acetylglucosaminyl)-L-asparaginase [Telluria sp.]|nr:N(4)-(beta-N-acetylglucosaminyl)-L-asparaginase [Telluria sp.]